MTTTTPALTGSEEPEILDDMRLVDRLLVLMAAVMLMLSAPAATLGNGESACDPNGANGFATIQTPVAGWERGTRATIEGQ
ncbi:MAG TPA: hypothetical protein VF971_03970, partial [Candidatus Limnocylindrales bacterium]